MTRLTQIITIVLFLGVISFCCATRAAILLPGGSPDPNFSGLNVWYDAGSIGIADGNAIDAWHSSAATANTAAAFTAARRPTFVVSGLGGLPAVSFDGIDDQLRMATSYFSEASALPLTIFTVLQTSDTSAHVIGTGSSGNGYLSSFGYGLVIDGSASLKANFNSNGIYLQAATTDLSNGGLVTSIAANAGSSIAINGLTESSDNVSSLFPYFNYSQATLGASDGSGSGNSVDPFAGSISEILVYGSLSPSEVDQVNDYLMDKYFPVPEPSSLVLAFLGVITLCFTVLHRRGAGRAIVNATFERIGDR